MGGLSLKLYKCISFLANLIYFELSSSESIEGNYLILSFGIMLYDLLILAVISKIFKGTSVLSAAERYSWFLSVIVKVFFSYWISLITLILLIKAYLLTLRYSTVLFANNISNLNYLEISIIFLILLNELASIAIRSFLVLLSISWSKFLFIF